MRNARSCAPPLAAVAVLAVLWLRPPTLHVTGMAAAGSLDEVVGAVAAAAARLAFGWLATSTLLAYAARLPGVTGRICAAVSVRVTPVVLRRALSGAVGVTVIAAPALPAAAATAAVQAPAGATAAPRLDRVPGPAPSVHRAPAPPGVPPRAGSPAPPRPPATPRRTVVVTPGDSLWRLAGRSLGSHATSRAIAREWPRWYAANRVTVGADPDVLHPGQRLVAPR